jgi:hypothetical protein
MRFVAGLDPKVREFRWFVVVDFNDIFQAVVDESGYAAADCRYPNDALVFAGYVGKIADWANFTHAWKAIIEDHPELNDTEFVKALMRWKGSKSDPRAMALMNAVVENPRLGSIRWTLPYRALREGADRVPGEEEMYFFAWSGVLTHCVATILPIPNARLEFIYDQNIHEESKVQTAYVNYRRAMVRAVPDLADRLARRPQPMNDADFWPLRAADGLAWNTHRHWIRQTKGKQFSNPLWRAMDAGPMAIDETWDAQDVRDILSDAKGQDALMQRRIRVIYDEATRMGLPSVPRWKRKIKK